MCNPIEEKVKSKVESSMLMTCPAGAWPFKVSFVFYGKLEPLNKYAEDLSACVSVIQPPRIFPGYNDILGHVHINFQEREGHFVTKFFNTLERLYPADEKEQKGSYVLVTLHHFENNNKEKLTEADLWQCEPSDIQIAPYSYKDKDPDGIMISWELDVKSHSGDTLDVNSGDTEKSK